MASVAPNARTPLSADARFRLAHTGFAHIPHYRPADVDMALSAVLMSAFAMFSLKAPALLAFDKERAEGHVPPIYGMRRVPCDTHLRDLLDPIAPTLLRPMCPRLLRQRQRGKARAALPFLAGPSLVALDGPRAVSSKTIHCASCLHQVHRPGSITSPPQRLGAALMHPDGRAVLPLMPAPIVQHEGTGKNAGARNAAKRFVANLRHDHPHRRCMVTDDSVSAKAPPLATLHAYGLRDLLGGKAGEPTVLCQPGQAAAHAGHGTYEERHDRAAQVGHRCRFVHDVPLNAANPDVRVHFLAYWERGQDKVQPFRWVTDIRVSKRKVYPLMRGGRARWKIDNETFQTLKNQGYTFDHNYGHGEQHRAVGFAMLLLLAFFGDQTQQLWCA